MAVIDELGLEAKVVVNGATAPEYDDPEPGSLGDKYSGNTVKCFRYVESTDDAEFEIAFQAHAYNWPKTAGFALFFHLQVDGKSVGSRLLKEKDGLRQQWINGRVIQDTASHTGFSLQRTRFSKVLTVDDADKKKVTADMETARHLGLLRIKVTRVVVTGSSATLPSSSKMSSDNLSLAEKSLKGRAISHATGFSSAIPCRYTGGQVCNYLDRHPIAIFFLQYRSQDALKSQMIIPRERSRTMSPGPAGVAGLSQEEIHRLAQERLSQIKQEKNERGGKIIKREAGETIDLTGRAPKRVRHKLIKLESGRAAIDLTEDND